jgi:hypothetical protein
VDGLGRDFCAHLKVLLESAEKFEVCQVLGVAIESGVCQWDERGHLPFDHPRTNLYALK